MPLTTYGKSVNPFSHFIPGLEAGTGIVGKPALGQMVIVSTPIGAPLLVDSVTYKHALFIAPSDGCRIVSGWLSGAVANSAATNTLAIDNYDASGNAARNVLSATNIDPDLITALEGYELTLSATSTNLDMDKGDVLNCTLVVGTPCTNGEGHVLTFVIWVPYPAGK